MSEEKNGRSWDSVCGECVHFSANRCAHTRRAAAARDSIAAVCRWYEGAVPSPLPNAPQPAGDGENKITSPLC